MSISRFTHQSQDGIMKSESKIKSIIMRELKKYPKKSVTVLGEEYDFFIFSEDEKCNLFEGFLAAEVADEKQFHYLKRRYNPPVNGFVPRIALIFYNGKLLIKDYRTNKHIMRTLSKINRFFTGQIKKALSSPGDATFSKLFDRTAIIEEFYNLYEESRNYLLETIDTKDTPDEPKKEVVDMFMMQMLTLWYLQERKFFDNDPSYFVTTFQKVKQGTKFNNYYDFITYFLEKIARTDGITLKDPFTGTCTSVRPALFFEKNDLELLSIPDECFYQEGMTDLLINEPSGKVRGIPLLNLLESRDWTEGVFDEFVLGALYEKVIASRERKIQGVYYTPEEVTQYICRNTILVYLTDAVNTHFGTQFQSLDEILKTDDEHVLSSLFQELKEIKILDPSVGSAHFLESAVDVLLEIWEALWEKKKGVHRFTIQVVDEKGVVSFVNLFDISDKKRFRVHVLFFIVFPRNIYGVDTNENVIKIAKARLFLTLAKHVTSPDTVKISDVHFNLKTGNSLLGYTQLEPEKALSTFSAVPCSAVDLRTLFRQEAIYQVKEHLRLTNAFKPLCDITESVEELKEILSTEPISWEDMWQLVQLKENLNRLFITSLNSQGAQPLCCYLDCITAFFAERLDEKFAEDHNLDTPEREKVNPFHWILEFPEVFLNKDGFDIVIGNPPYVDVYEVSYKSLLRAKNLYDAFMRTSLELLHKGGIFGLIHANSAYCQPKYSDLRNFLKQHANDMIIIHFGIRPQPVFKGVMQRTTITVCKKDSSEPKRVKTSRYLRLTEENRNQILQNPPVYDSSRFAFNFKDFVPKIGNKMDYEIFGKVFSSKNTIKDLVEDNGVPIFYHDSGESYWTKAVNYEPKGYRNGQKVRASQWFEIQVILLYSDFVLCVINSSLFYWYWLTVSDCRHLTQKVLLQFPVPHKEKFTQPVLERFKDLAGTLMGCYRKNSSYVKKREGYASLEFKVSRCKSVITEVDYLVGKIYGLTDQEIEYLTEYDFKMKIE